MSRERGRMGDGEGHLVLKTEHKIHKIGVVYMVGKEGYSKQNQ